MKRRKSVLEKQEVIYKNADISIINIGNQIIFEIKEHTTLDLSEAVSLMIKLGIEDTEVWYLPSVLFDADINPEKTLYWLSGGDKEWVLLENYQDSWFNLYHDFCEKWENHIYSIIKNSKNLLDIKLSFEKELNLMVFYDWSISKGFIR
jgi:hypothetical protein